MKDNNPNFNREDVLRKDLNESSHPVKDELEDSIDELKNVNAIFSDAVLYKVVKPSLENLMKTKKSTRGFMTE